MQRLCSRVGKAAVIGAMFAVAAACPAQGVQTEHLRIVGGLAGVNQYTRHEEPFWTKELTKLTNGRATAEIVPFDRAGLSGEEMLRIVQMGSIPFGTALLGRSAAVEPELMAPDLAGSNPDFASVKRTIAAYRPRMAQLLRERYGVELLAVYLYPAQVTYCVKPIRDLADLAGRRVRVSSVTQADFVNALGAQPVQTPFNQVVAAIRSGTIDCAITGTMSGNTIGLHEVTSHVHTMAVSWGLAAFVANSAAWAELSAPVRAVLQREMPRLEQQIWAESDRETSEGLACNSGASTCKSGRKGRMTVVESTPADEQRRVDLLHRVVVPAWVKRCGNACSTQWRDSLSPSASQAR